MGNFRDQLRENNKKFKEDMAKNNAEFKANMAKTKAGESVGKPLSSNTKIIIWLVIFFPVGLYLMFKSSWQTKTKTIVGGLYASLAIVIALAGIYAPPTVEVANMQANSVVQTDDDSYEVKGKIYPYDAQIMVNGQVVSANSVGEFATRVALAEGDNTVSITATDGDKVTKKDFAVSRTSSTVITERQRQSDAQKTAQAETDAQNKAEQDKQNRRYYWHKVVDVVDGDTVLAMIDGKQETVNLLGIDAPEITGGQQCYGAEAHGKTKEFLTGKWIQIESETRDTSGQLRAYVWFDSGTDLGRRLVEEGYAYAGGAAYAKQAQYTDTQSQASNKSHGLWSQATCKGQRAIPVAAPPTPAPAAPSAPRQQATPQPKPAPAPASGGVVKKSNTSICHAPGSTYYNQTKNFTPYPDLQSCLESGGRMPKR